MTEYRRVIVVTVMVTLFIVVIVPFLPEAGASALFALVLVAEAMADVIATLYVGKLVLDDPRRPRSWLLLFLFTGALFITLGMVPIGAILVIRLLGYPPVGPAGVVVAGMGLILAGAVPILKATLFALVRRDPTADATDGMR